MLETVHDPNPGPASGGAGAARGGATIPYARGRAPVSPAHHRTEYRRDRCYRTGSRAESGRSRKPISISLAGKCHVRINRERCAKTRRLVGREVDGGYAILSCRRRLLQLRQPRRRKHRRIGVICVRSRRVKGIRKAA